MVKSRQFWCHNCDDWTDLESASDDSFWCKTCGGDYVCDECGYDIDRSGTCQRPEGHEVA